MFGACTWRRVSQQSAEKNLNMKINPHTQMRSNRTTESTSAPNYGFEVLPERHDENHNASCPACEEEKRDRMQISSDEKVNEMLHVYAPGHRPIPLERFAAKSWLKVT